MKFQPTLLALALTTLPPAVLQAHAANVTSMSITGGTFTLGGSPGYQNPWSGYSYANIIGGDQAFGSPFLFFTTPVSLFNSNEGATNTYAPYGGSPVNGGDASSISATINGNVLIADLSGWSMNWNGANYNLGANAVTGSVDAAGHYTLSWSSTMVGGSYNGYTTNWSISGVAAVPEASTYGMMIAGLGLTAVAVARRRKIR